MNIDSFIAGGLVVALTFTALEVHLHMKRPKLSLSDRIWNMINEETKEISKRADGRLNNKSIPYDAAMAATEQEMANFQHELSIIRDLSGSVTLEFKGGKGGD